MRNRWQPYGKSDVRPTSILWVYDPILKPRLTYASVAWSNKTNLSTAKQGLERNRGLILRNNTGAMKTAPTVAMGDYEGLEPLQMTLKVKASKACFRIQTTTTRRCAEKRITPLGKWVAVGTLDMPLDHIRPRLLFDKKNTEGASQPIGSKNAPKYRRRTFGLEISGLTRHERRCIHNFGSSYTIPTVKKNTEFIPAPNLIIQTLQLFSKVSSLPPESDCTLLPHS